MRIFWTFTIVALDKRRGTITLEKAKLNCCAVLLVTASKPFNHPGLVLNIAVTVYIGDNYY